MRLQNLRIRNFRGFGAAVEPIRLGGDLVLLFGPNGFGKTSVAEAIEWLFYGSTKRRQRGEAYSRSEFANSFANVHGGQPVEVEAIVDIGGKEVQLLRRLTTNESSETFVDSSRAPFSSIGISPLEAVYPVVAQHGLQTFIHSKPKDRRDAICAALGLDELTSLKSTLDGARTSMQRSPPQEVVKARRELGEHALVLARIPATTELAARWRRSPMQVRGNEDIDSLIRAAQSLTGSIWPTVSEALASLRDERAKASKAVFDADVLAIADPDEATTALSGKRTATDSALSKVEQAIGVVTAAIASAYAIGLLEFWQKGLDIAADGTTCPMCEAETLDTIRRAELRRRLDVAASQLANSRTLSEAVDEARLTAQSVATALGQFGVKELVPDQLGILDRIFEEDPKALRDFLATHGEFVGARRSLLDAAAAATDFLDGCQARLADPAQAPGVVADLAQIKNALSSTVQPVLDNVLKYRRHWTAFERDLTSRLATNETILRIDAVGKSLRDETKIRLVERHEQALQDTQQLIREIETQIQTRQTALLTTRGAEVKSIYDRLNQGANVTFEEMEPGTDSMKLYASSFGVRMPAAANLSECQLNCLGLSMWLMRATTPTSPFGFVLLDDPVQSMDDDHAEAFMSDIVPFLLDQHGKQVILLSHVQKITDRLRALNQNRSARLYHFDSYGQGGPTITEQIALRMLLAEIKGAARGNEGNRKYAVDRIRVLTENFIRELHLKLLGSPAPPKFDRATAKELLPLFQTIPTTTPQEHVSLRDTIGFCDPAHHTQVGYSVPLLSNIQPHFDRLENLMNKYGL